VNRARISSQCLKRSIRQSEVFRQTMADYLGVRTRRMPLELETLLKERGVAAEAVAAIVRKAPSSAATRKATTARHAS